MDNSSLKNKNKVKMKKIAPWLGMLFMPVAIYLLKFLSLPLNQEAKLLFFLLGMGITLIGVVHFFCFKAHDITFTPHSQDEALQSAKNAAKEQNKCLIIMGISIITIIQSYIACFKFYASSIVEIGIIALLLPLVASIARFLYLQNNLQATFKYYFKR